MDTVQKLIENRITFSIISARHQFGFNDVFGLINKVHADDFDIKVEKSYKNAFVFNLSDRDIDSFEKMLKEKYFKKVRSGEWGTAYETSYGSLYLDNLLRRRFNDIETRYESYNEAKNEIEGVIDYIDSKDGNLSKTRVKKSLNTLRDITGDLLENIEDEMILVT